MADEGLFAKRLRAARSRKAIRLGYKTARGFSQERLGVEAGIDEATASARINQYEQGVHIPDMGTASRLAEVLDIPVAYLFCREEELAELLLLAYELSARKRKELVRAAEGMRRQQ